MENLALISVKPVLTPTLSQNPRFILPKKSSGFFFLHKPTSKFVPFAFSPNFSSKKVSINHENNENNTENNAKNVLFARASTAHETTSVGVNPQPYVSPPPPQFGSPLFWIGVGVGFSALFSFVASWLKKYAMQQAFKTMMGQMGSQNNQFSNSAFPSGSPFGFPPPSASSPTTFPGFPYQPPSGPSTPTTTTATASRQPSTLKSGPSNATSSAVTPAPPSPAASETVDVTASKPEVTEPIVNDNTEPKQSAFVDISPEETSQPSPFENYNDTSSQRPSDPSKFAEVVQNGTVPKEGTSSEWSQETRKSGSSLSVETIEKMMEDPNIQKMIYPQLPEEMRNPATFKWMLQNPVYRQQLQEMLDNMNQGGLDTSTMESLKNFDLNSPEVKQQFNEIGLTPEEAMSRIISNPEIAMAFQNPRIQAAMMDFSQNPMNIMKYQNDKEVMDVFNKIQQLFPESPGF
ncbi:hypothetical protein RND81_01G210500 [Saponaria officinalis]|uniref:Protein TIC 40, chloroplastic n=1 Tax=Saponaria officinalis TaxID=3572 RepID=A0AAW1NIT9_SAPOF